VPDTLTRLRTYRSRQGVDHLTADHGPCYTCGKLHPAEGSEQDMSDFARGTLWLKDPAFARALEIVEAEL